MFFSVLLLQAGVDMVQVLLDNGGNVSTETNEEGQNILHRLAAHCMNSDTTTLLDTFMVELFLPFLPKTYSCYFLGFVVCVSWR